VVQAARDYFSRIEPVLGPGLADKRLAWLNLTECEPVIELLVGCRLRRFIWLETEGEAQQLEQRLQQHNHFEAGWEFKPFAPDAPPNLLLAGGSPEIMLTGLKLAQLWKVPALLFSGLSELGGYKAVAIVCLPEANLEVEQSFLEQLPEADSRLEPEVIALVAAVAKALLLEGTPYNRYDYKHLFNTLGQTVLLMGHSEWPWQVRFTQASKINYNSKLGSQNFIPGFQPLSSPPTHVAIFGCGGLGSLIAKELNLAGVARFSLLDSGKVQIFHPVRQFYHTSQLGHPKVYALTENLLGQDYSFKHYPARLGQPRFYYGSKTIVSYNLKLNDNWVAAVLERLVTDIQPNLAVITTGTNLDYYLARALQRAKIPYLVARCYPRSRYFELIFSLPAKGTPCFDCLRGHLYTGPHPGLTEEEQARYEHGRAVTLEAEPATLVETSRAAAVAARLGLEMLSSVQAGWFRELIAEGQTCLIGANETQYTAQGWAYGLSLPGQVAAFGLNQLFSSEKVAVCPTCGRVNQPTTAIF